jgi:hypothetical protein
MHDPFDVDAVANVGEWDPVYDVAILEDADF